MFSNTRPLLYFCVHVEIENNEERIARLLDSVEQKAYWDVYGKMYGFKNDSLISGCIVLSLYFS